MILFKGHEEYKPGPNVIILHEGMSRRDEDFVEKTEIVQAFKNWLAVKRIYPFQLVEDNYLFLKCLDEQGLYNTLIFNRGFSLYIDSLVTSGISVSDRTFVMFGLPGITSRDKKISKLDLIRWWSHTSTPLLTIFL